MAIRERIRMSAGEIAAFLDAPHKMQLASINRDGTPHLVTMYYAVHDDGRLAFWTYRRSQKARNLERDPRCTCLVETGADYDQFQGVQIRGRVEAFDDVDAVLAIGTRVYGRYLGGGLLAGLEAVLLDQAQKRRAYLVTPEKVTSWDHRKLAAQGAAMTMTAPGGS
jgi:PPOX class probable F420-dependent enzyme